ncbi:zinc finger BED domain-containing protein 4-like [Anthonomus grandis grandis]|uniref:zinc finger BED domain-containing protein 4-like n=1 Tax=Anthonomus grandis grandis TaxID=2921223 RepID=UPI00216605EA|nr:zinc finger BED domain-containing protein 4-like [Anthonomus grandis grandis]
MIALDNLPYSIVTNLGFQRLMFKVAPQYTLPGRKYFTENIVPNIYDRLVTVIKNSLLNVDSLSLTSDLWTCSHTNESFISFTGHWFDSDFKYNHVVLNCKHFPGSHTGESIKNVFFDMLNMWNINISKVHLMVRDNGANIVKCCNDAEIPSVSCFIHNLQLVITQTIDTQRSVLDLIATCKKMVGHFNHSSAACTKLKEIQTELNIPGNKLIQEDDPTRWNSTFLMIKRIYEQKRALTVYAADHNVDNLTSNQWVLLESLINLLQPFEEITKKMSSNKALISEVLPTVVTLKKYLMKDQAEFFGVGTMKQIVFDQISKRFDVLFKNKFFVISTILDPRFKLAFFQSDNLENYKQYIIDEYEHYFSVQGQSTNSDDDDIPLLRIQQTVYLENNLSDKTSEEVGSSQSKLWQCFDKIAASSATKTPNKNSIKDEFEMYLSLPLINRTENPTTWWKDRKTVFPKLLQILLKFLTAPASSVYSERSFSEAGNIYDETRSRLLPKNAEKLLFIHHNLPLVNFQY